MQWIKCSDRLPKINGTSAMVFIYHPKRQCILTAYRHTMRHRSKKYYWLAHDFDGSSHFDSDEIQHWMPLPEPPKE